MKQIRPLSAYKKANPQSYENLYNESESTSKKSKENDFYWLYAFCNLNQFDKSLLEKTPQLFFFKNEHNRNNKLTITEIGRLLLTGWYYGIEEFTKELSVCVEKSYYKKIKDKVNFNDLEFYEVIKHIRQNLDYYHINKNEAILKIQNI